MIIIEKNTEKILETQPYEMFLRKFKALQIGTSSSLHIQIEPTNKECLEEFKCGFTIDPCYAKRYMLDFQYNSLSDENDRYSLVHCLAFEFKAEFRDMMYDTISAIQKRHYYLSSLIEEYNINCTIDGNLAMIKWYTNCLKSDIKEVSLTLLGADIALFARGF